MRMPRILTIVATIALLIWLMIPSQEGDPGFNPSVESPANTTAHVRVYFDAGHWNVHKADGRYKPFADLLRSDGYEIVSQKGEFTAKKLEGFQLLVIANALGLRGAAQQIVNIFHGDKYCM